MKITKYGHCCLLVEHEGKNILTDPGGWTDLPQNLPHIDIILITHEHADHLDVSNLNWVLDRSPEAIILTNATTAAKFSKDYKWKYEAVSNGHSGETTGADITTWQSQHAEVYASIPRVDNTSFLIGGSLYIPGDSFFVPDKQVKVLALPVCGPWLHMREVIDYAKAIKPETAFPIHDGMLSIQGPFHAVPQMLLEEAGINFKPMLAGDTLEI